MVQKIFGIDIGTTGIVGTLVVTSILLKAFDVSPGTGDLAISGGVGIGFLLGLLGVFAVAKRVIR